MDGRFILVFIFLIKANLAKDTQLLPFVIIPAWGSILSVLNLPTLLCR